MGGDEGEGGLNPDKIGSVHPHLNPPPSNGEDIIEEISNIFGQFSKSRIREAWTVDWAKKFTKTLKMVRIRLFWTSVMLGIKTLKWRKKFL